MLADAARLAHDSETFVLQVQRNVNIKPQAGLSNRLARSHSLLGSFKHADRNWKIRTTDEGFPTCKAPSQVVFEDATLSDDLELRGNDSLESLSLGLCELQV